MRRLGLWSFFFLSLSSFPELTGPLLSEKVLGGGGGFGSVPVSLFFQGVAMQTVSEEWLEAHKTERGGWTRVQLQILGIAWPPRRGWKKTLVGTAISDDRAAAFAAGSAVQGQVQ